MKIILVLLRDYNYHFFAAYCIRPPMTIQWLLLGIKPQICSEIFNINYYFIQANN